MTHEGSGLGSCESDLKKLCELKQYLDDISDYDNVAGPCWWGTYPMAVFSQLERLDFTGKRVQVI